MGPKGVILGVYRVKVGLKAGFGQNSSKGVQKGSKRGHFGVVLGVSRVKVGLKAGFEEMAQKGSKRGPK